jgi:hypothetical protein
MRVGLPQAWQKFELELARLAEAANKGRGRPLKDDDAQSATSKNKNRPAAANQKTARSSARGQGSSSLAAKIPADREHPVSARSMNGQ